jgi:hypothetical protein
MDQDPSNVSGARAFPRPLALEDSAHTSANVSIGDVNGDGHLDVVLVKGRHWPLQNLVRLGDGAGGFGSPRAVGPGPDRSYTGALLDLDGDGDLDMIVSNDSPDPKRVLHNDGSGVFTQVQTFGEPEWNTRHISVGDLNGDGLPDLLVANRGGRGSTASYLCIGLADGTFRDPCTPVYEGSATTVTPADMNGDGHTDLVIPHRDGGQSLVLVNDGTGVFPDTVRIGPADAAYRSSRVGDFDGDGHNDVVVIDPRSGTGVFYGSPDGGFGPLAALGDEGTRPYAVLVADVDGSGSPDVIVGYVGSAPTVFFNDGPGTFTPVSFGDAEGAAYGFAVADLDGDGLLDIAMARSDAPNMIYFGGRDGG